MVNRTSGVRESRKSNVNSINQSFRNVRKLHYFARFDTLSAKPAKKVLIFFNPILSQNRKPDALWLNSKKTEGPDLRANHGKNPPIKRGGRSSEFYGEMIGSNIMAHSTDKSVQKTRFAIADLQKRIGVLEATREDLERQIR